MAWPIFEGFIANLSLNIFSHAVPWPITVGYERTVYTTTDAAGEVELCVVITSPATGAPREFTLLTSSSTNN